MKEKNREKEQRESSFVSNVNPTRSVKGLSR